MIDIDQTIAKLNVTGGIDGYRKYVDDNYKLSYEIMEDGDQWLLY